jgi:hypothetical protein
LLAACCCQAADVFRALSTRHILALFVSYYRSHRESCLRLETAATFQPESRMDAVKNKLATLDIKEPAAILEAFLALQILAGFGFLICSFVVAHTENSGFNVVLTGLLNLIYSLASYYALGKLKTPIIIGAAIGGGMMISFLSFMTAIYWGQLSLCQELDESVRHYSCDQKVAYRATCFFAVIMFLLQVSVLSFYFSLSPFISHSLSLSLVAYNAAFFFIHILFLLQVWKLLRCAFIYCICSSFFALN